MSHQTTEQQGTYETDTAEAVEMLGAGYQHRDAAVEITPPSTSMERRDGQFREVEKPAFVKISTAFKGELMDIDPVALKVWLFISLSVNRYSGKANPGLRAIANGTNLAVNTVQAALVRLETEYNLLTVQRDERKYNVYEPVAFVSANRVDPVSAIDTDEETQEPSVSIETPSVSVSEPSVSTRREKNAQPENQINQKDIYTSPSKKIKPPPDPVVQALIAQGIFPNPQTDDYLRDWRKAHTDERIIQAIEKSAGTNHKYIDTMLLGWEANGYPPTREERIAAARKGKNNGNSNHPRRSETPEITDRARRNAGRILALQGEPSPAAK